MFNLNVPESEEIINRVKEIIEKADASEFNKRDKGLKLNIFLEAFTVSLCSMQTITLEGIANKCEELQEEMQKYGFSMTKQSLFRRLEQGSKELKKVLENVINLDIEKMVSKPQIAMVLEQFRSVDITDSTTITLPDKLEEFHKGLGGKNAKSAMKIQATYNIKGKDFKKISIIEDATTSDGSYVTELIKEMQMNDLSICDLGYYGIEGFQGIAEKGAYFISKIKTNTNVYEIDKKTDKIDLKNLLKDKLIIDKEVVVKGAQGKWMEVRLVGIKLPEKVYNERIRKARKDKAKGEELTADEIERLKWILIITNVEEEILDAETICELYRIRWQVELIFKTWKSYFSIDEMNNVGKVYLDCLIYGKLIVITMLNCLYSHLFYKVHEDLKRLISYMRFMKNIREELGNIIDYITGSIQIEKLTSAIVRVVKSSLIEIRKRKTTEQSLASFDLPEEVLKMLY